MAFWWLWMWRRYPSRPSQWFLSPALRALKEKTHVSSRSSLLEKFLPRAGGGGSFLPEVSTRCMQFARLPTAKFFSVRTRISPSLSAPPVQARAAERRNHHACAVAGDLPGGTCARNRAGKRREMRAHTPVVFSHNIFLGLHPFLLWRC